QTPVRSGPQHVLKQGQRPILELNGFTNPSMNCYSPSPVKASFQNGEPRTSPARLVAVSRSPDPVQKCRQYSDGRYSPKNKTRPISRRLRTPSPVQSKMRTYTTAKNSKSSLRLDKIPKFEEQEREKLYKIANEFLQTERAYVARLHLLDQVFCSRLTEEANRGSFPPELVKHIFSNVSSIFSFHSQFLLPDLENCISLWNDCPGLGGVLLQLAPFMRMYADYVRNFEKSLELVRTWSARSSAFKNIIQDIQSLEVCGCLTLEHHMLEPVQRLPRYELLLRDYLKKLPEDHPDHQPAQKSLQTISMATIHSNSAIKKAEGLRKLLEIYEMVGEEDVVNPTNEFLKEGRLVKLAARNTSAMERQLFLFNNFLLCCSPKFSLVGQRYMVRCRIGVDGMNVQRTMNEGHPFSFQVSGKEKTLELQASAEEERDEWIKVLNCIYFPPTCNKKSIFKDFIVQAKELGRRAPKWIRDNEVTMCMKCHEPFNPLTRRRHHCRACGCVVCWKCSDNKVALEYDGNKLNKVCKSCFLSLTTQRGVRPRADVSHNVSNVFFHTFIRPEVLTPTWQRIWTVLPKNDPTVLHLYAAPQDVKPQFTIPLLGYTVEGCVPKVHGHVCFRLTQSKITHTFFCDDTDLGERWMAVLKNATENTTSPRTATEPCKSNVSDAGSCCSDDCHNWP
uniref:FYVE, RhoGEF and PH domain containing 4b n=1 Tax=Neogobius melanostomus TaxID=47308 RepID=A0A8C6TP85_9GOBI